MGKERRRGTGKRSKVGPWLLGAVLALTAGVLVVSGVVLYKSTASRNADPNAEQISVAQRFVSAKFQGVNLFFGNRAETTVVKLSPTDYRVSGSLDVVAADGASVHDAYSCDIRRPPGGAWVPTQVLIFPRL